MMMEQDDETRNTCSVPKRRCHGRQARSSLRIGLEAGRDGDAHLFSRSVAGTCSVCGVYGGSCRTLMVSMGTGGIDTTICSCRAELFV